LEKIIDIGDCVRILPLITAAVRVNTSSISRTVFNEFRCDSPHFNQELGLPGHERAILSKGLLGSSKFVQLLVDPTYFGGESLVASQSQPSKR
jgi:hypothetical protein